jgi:hypothetical protein
MSTAVAFTAARSPAMTARQAGGGAGSRVAVHDRVGIAVGASRVDVMKASIEIDVEQPRVSLGTRVCRGCAEAAAPEPDGPATAA